MRLHDFLDYRARLQPRAEFAVFGQRRLSYGEARATANRIAQALRHHGLGPGDRFGILAKNSIESILLYYGASKAGVVPVPLNYRLAPPEWKYILDDAGVRLVVARGEYVEALDAVLDDLPAIRTCVAVDGHGARWTRWDDFLAAMPADAPDEFVPETADVYQMYTSGTTGHPKGAMLTHAAVCANLHQGALALGGVPGERWLIVAPVYHAAAALTAFSCVQAGGTLVIHEDFDPVAVVEALSRQRIAVALLVPAMLQACLVGVRGVEDRRYDDLRLIVYGASPIAEKTLRQALLIFECDFVQGYGMTETTAAATYLFPQDHQRALDGDPRLLLSAGRPLVGTEIRIVDEHDTPLPANTLGEICIRGPQLMRGYWNREEASREALRGGWMHTGDAGFVDDEGFLFIQDRVKDMIVSGGENVYPREVEEVLFQHPAVADAAVIGIPDERWGESVKAFVVLRPTYSLEPQALIDFCRERLANYKRPRSVDLVATLPRNPSGKVLKRELRETYWKGHERRIAGS